jgi:hypothetical protein
LLLCDLKYSIGPKSGYRNTQLAVAFISSCLALDITNTTSHPLAENTNHVSGGSEPHHPALRPLLVPSGQALHAIGDATDLSRQVGLARLGKLDSQPISYRLAFQ